MPTVAGLRVIRGHGWKQGEADGGEGHVGTVTAAKDDGSVEVTWDGGQVTACKASELLVMDNATVGVRHVNHTCDSCQETAIVGMRWHCTVCDDYDLCSLCYFSDQHDLAHEFLRHENIDSTAGVKVEKRNKSKKIRVMGIYPDATVSRGRHWEWNDQDGGIGAKGTVIDVVTLSNSSSRSSVKVKWSGSDVTNVYRVGFKGKVDLQYTEEAPGGDCYPDHLPVLDPKKYVTMTSSGSDVVDSCMNEGDKVVVAVSAEELQQLQKSRSGWAVSMAQCVGKIGEIKGFAGNGDVVVAFGAKKYRLVPRALKKVARIDVGDRVRVISDEEEVKVLQENHGGYNENMTSALGMVGEVIKLDGDGDAVVEFGQQKWLLNPACLIPAPGEEVDKIELDPTVARRRVLQRGDSTVGALNQLLGALFAAAGESLGEKLMMKACVDEDVGSVRELIEKDKDLVQAQEQGVSALHVAANRGNMQITQLLVDNGADVNKVDGDGDTPLLICMKSESVAEYLINKGASITVANNNGQTPAHKAAQHGNVHIIKLLMKKGIDMNIVDAAGDTPMHDAIDQNRHSVVEALMTWPKINLRHKNTSGFSPLAFCALKGTPTIAELLVRKDRSLVDEQKDDGFTPLQIAAVNNHTDVMKILLDIGKAKLDMRNKEGATALHCAAHEAYMDAVQLLIQHGADVNAKDKDGDRPLHMCMVGRDGDLDIEGSSLEKQLLLALLGQTTKSKEEERIRIAQLLLKSGAAFDARNDKGMTAYDACDNDVIKNAVKQFIDVNPNLTKSHRPALVREMSQSAIALCRKCLINRASILFVPCGHRSACYECCAKFKIRQCPQCGKPSKSRFDSDGKEISSCVVM